VAAEIAAPPEERRDSVVNLGDEALHVGVNESMHWQTCL